MSIKFTQKFTYVLKSVNFCDKINLTRLNLFSYAIQVKTTGYKKKKWTLSSKNKSIVVKNIIYVFVSLNELDVPEYHIVPSESVARTIKKTQYGDKNPSCKFIELLNDVITEKIEDFIIKNAEHNFTNMLEEFINLPEKYLLDALSK